jgi:hypothetical protein
VQTGLPIGVTDPSKLFAQPFVACHETVKGQNDEEGENVPIFPENNPALGSRSQAAARRVLPLFPELLYFLNSWRCRERMPPPPIGIGG